MGVRRDLTLTFTSFCKLFSVWPRKNSALSLAQLGPRVAFSIRRAKPRWKPDENPAHAIGQGRQKLSSRGIAIKKLGNDNFSKFNAVNIFFFFFLHKITRRTQHSSSRVVLLSSAAYSYKISLKYFQQWPGRSVAPTAEQRLAQEDAVKSPSRRKKNGRGGERHWRRANAEHTASAFRKTVTSQSVLTLILYIAAVYAKENTFIRKVIRYQLMRWYGVIRVSLPCF